MSESAEQVPLLNFLMTNQANQHIPVLDKEFINGLSNSMQQSFLNFLQKQQQAQMENQLRDLLHFFFNEKNMASDRTVCIILNYFIRICILNPFFYCSCLVESWREILQHQWSSRLSRETARSFLR